MPFIAIDYRFSQRFAFPARRVYAWVTDFQPHDIDLQGKKGRRKAVPLCDGAILVTDTFVTGDGRRVSKKKIIRLYPRRLSYTNTHLAGPNKYSQYVYEIVPEGARSSRLDFTGREVRSAGAMTKRQLTAHARLARSATAAIWRRLARAMARDLAPRR